MKKEKKEFKELTDEQLEKVTGGIGLKCAEELKALCQVPLTAACICTVMQPLNYFPEQGADYCGGSCYIAVALFGNRFFHLMIVALDAVCMVAGCQKYDDSDLRKQLQEHREKLASGEDVACSIRLCTRPVP